MDRASFRIIAGSRDLLQSSAHYVEVSSCDKPYLVCLCRSALCPEIRMFYPIDMERDPTRDHPETVSREIRNGTQDRPQDSPETALKSEQNATRDVQWDRMTVPEAADALKVTQSAVRKRIQRGTIPWDKDVEGRICVYVDPTEIGPETGGRESRDATSGPSRDELVDSLEDQIRFLRGELERKDTLLMALMQRVPELEGPKESSGTSNKPPTSASAGERAPESSRESEEVKERRSWLRRFFFGP